MIEYWISIDIAESIQLSSDVLSNESVKVMVMIILLQIILRERDIIKKDECDLITPPKHVHFPLETFIWT